MRLKRREVLSDYIRVIEKTKSGLDHAHIIYRGSYIDQQVISHLWDDIHQSPVVDIRSVHASPRGKREAAAYLAKYMAKEGHRRYSWSWGWVYRGFVQTWKDAKKLWRQYNGWLTTPADFNQFLSLWCNHLRTHSPPGTLLALLEADRLIVARMAL